MESINSIAEIASIEHRIQTPINQIRTNSISSLLTNTSSSVSNTQSSQNLIQTQTCQSPCKRSFVKSLRNNLHLKCLVLSLLIGTCLLAIFWCSFTTFTKVMVNLNSYVLSKKKNTCDQAYFYIPSVFVVAFYLLYLIECFHSETRFSLKHVETSDQVMNEIEKLKNSLPVIWWKALNYHYLRRTKLVTRYRNGEAYSTTQVYFQRINSRITSTSYNYGFNDNLDSNNVTDISKKVTNLDKYPLTKIKFSKGFAFSNIQTANEFERQRSLFFNSSEQLDDFLEMREGMDLISNRFRENVLCVSSRKPWYISQTAFWFFSIFLMSWPFRILIQLNTGYLNYQIIKLFNCPNTLENNLNTDSNNLLNEERNYNSNDDLLNCSLPPSYSQAMLWPPTYNYIKQLIYEQNTNTNENQINEINSNQNNVNNIIDKYSTEINQQNHKNTTKICFEDTNENILNQNKNKIPSSLSCSFLNGQIVFLINTLKQTNTLNSSIGTSLNCGNSLDIKNDDCMSLNNRVQIIGERSLEENISNLKNFDRHFEERKNKRMLTSSKKINSFLPRSLTSENISYLHRFSKIFIRKINSMQNLQKNVLSSEDVYV